MIPYGKQSIDKSDISGVVNTLKSDWLTQGPKVKEFEKALAEYCGAKYAVVCTNGTSALHLAYLAAGLKAGDEVITTPNTFTATSNMVLAVGAKPIFCDIRLDTYNIDENKIEKLINKRTKAIVPVHFAGQPCEMEKIKNTAKKYKLAVIEDACHALGSSYKNSRTGNCKYSDMAVFSFHPVKPITTGEGGAITTNNEKFYKIMLKLRTHGIEKDKNGFNVMTELGYNYRLTDIQAALGVSQLKRLDSFIAQRRKAVNWYKEELKNVKEIILPVEKENCTSGWHIYVIRTAGKKDRLPLYQYLLKNGVGVNFHYPAVYSHPYYQNHGYKKLNLANMEVYQHTAITLPCHAKLARKDIKYIGKIIKDYFDKI